MVRPKSVQPKDKKIQWWVTLKEEEFLKQCLASYRAEHSPAPKIIKTVPKSPAPKPVEVPLEILAGDKPIERVGRSPEEFLDSLGLSLPKVLLNESDDEDGVDYSAWREDLTMCEIDRGMCYEIDPQGYPDLAEKFANRHATLFIKAHKLKQLKRFSEFDQVMHDEIWPIVKKEF